MIIFFIIHIFIIIIIIVIFILVFTGVKLINKSDFIITPAILTININARLIISFKRTALTTFFINKKTANINIYDITVIPVSGFFIARKSFNTITQNVSDLITRVNYMYYYCFCHFCYYYYNYIFSNIKKLLKHI